MTQEFEVRVRANTVEEAFNHAREVAELEAPEGTAGYTGTIAEKQEFEVVPRDYSVPWDMQLLRLRYSHPAYDNKRGPAGCLQIKTGEWVFFGCSSS